METITPPAPSLSKPKSRAAAHKKASAPKKTHRKAPELCNADIKQDQPPAFDLGIPGEDEGFDRPKISDIVQPDKPEVVSADEQQMRNLLFEEEEVTIRIEQGQGEDAPIHARCSVNGTAIEFKRPDGTWFKVAAVGDAAWANVGDVFTTRRKYLGVLLHAKIMKIVTIPDKADGSQPRNIYLRNYNHAYTISIINDTPKGRDWAIKIMQQKA